MPHRLRDAAAEADQIVAQFPRLQARAQAQQEAGTDPHTAQTDAFEFGLEVVLDGLSARLGSPARPD
jgi:hypothetical protein